MEQITKREGKLYYGDVECQSLDDAYARFRKQHHKELGKSIHRRLNRAGSRKERIHGFGFVFSSGIPHRDEFRGYKKTNCRILGLADTSYYWIVGCWDFAITDEEQFWRWSDWAFSEGSGGIRKVGLNAKVGRTSKRINARYR